jgi:thioredoxin-related protein
MNRVVMWLLAIMMSGSSLLALPVEITESNQTVLKESNLSKIVLPKLDKQKLFQEDVKSLARLEFFKMYATINKKFLMVYFYSDGCYYCTKMKKKTLYNTQVKEELSKNYIVIKINYSRYKKEFKKNYHLQATPALFFFDKEGKFMDDESFYGYQGAEDFYNKVKLLAEPF